MDDRIKSGHEVHVFLSAAHQCHPRLDRDLLAVPLAATFEHVQNSSVKEWAPDRSIAAPGV